MDSVSLLARDGKIASSARSAYLPAGWQYACSGNLSADAAKLRFGDPSRLQRRRARGLAAERLTHFHLRVCQRPRPQKQSDRIICITP